MYIKKLLATATILTLSFPWVKLMAEDFKVENTSNSQKSIEQIIVTGSYIKRAGVEGYSPLKTLDSELFEETANTTIADLLKEDAAFDSVNEDTGHVRFHGQHAGNILVLLNGLNLPKKDGGFYTSIRSLPSSVIKRVEILKEGASSTYGSDAMGGVINFITRTDMDGSNISIATTVPEIGSGIRQSHSASWGKTFSKGNILGMIQFAKSQAVSEYDLNSFNRRDNAVTRPISDGRLRQGRNTVDIGESCGERVCQSDRLQFYQYQKPTTDLGTLLTGRYEFANMTTFSYLGMYNRTEQKFIGSPLSLDWVRDTSSGDQSLNGTSLKGTPWGHNLESAGIDLSDSVELEYNLVSELGPQVRDNLEQSYTIQSKLEGEMGETWNWTIQGGFSTLSSKSKMNGGNADQNILRQMAYNGEFVPGENSNLSKAMVKPTYKVGGELLTTKVFVNGELGDWGRGPLMASLGVDGRWENFRFENDASLTSGNLLTSTERNYSGQRDVYSAFAELESTPLNNMDVLLSARFDHYTDMGDTFNPKLAVSYKPLNQLLLRTSVGTGFRAPGISDIHRGNTREMSFFSDQYQCDREDSCSRDFYQLDTFVSPDLKAETALHYNLGASFAPNRNMSFIIDQWNFLGKDTISLIHPNEYTYLESRGHKVELERLGVVTERDDDTNQLKSIRIPHIVNMGEKTLRGVDIELDWKSPFFESTELRLNNSLTYVFEKKVRTFNFEQMRDDGQTWKNITSLSLQHNKHYGRVAARTISSISANNRRGYSKLPRTSIFDVTYSYNDLWGGKLNLGVKNILDKKPPVNENGSVVIRGSLKGNMRSLSALGRRYFMGYSRTF